MDGWITNKLSVIISVGCIALNSWFPQYFKPHKIVEIQHANNNLYLSEY